MTPLGTIGYIGHVDYSVGAVKGMAPDASPVSSSIGTMEACEELVRQIAPTLS